MARLKIELPAEFVFEYALCPRVTDLNYGGHVGNDRFLAYIQEARSAFYKHLGYTEIKLDDNGLGTILADSAVIYKREVFAGDPLLIRLAAAEFHKYGFDFVYQLFRTSDQVEVARAKTAVLCFNYQDRKLSEVPDWFRAAIKNE